MPSKEDEEPIFHQLWKVALFSFDFLPSSDLKDFADRHSLSLQGSGAKSLAGSNEEYGCDLWDPSKILRGMLELK